MKIKSWICGFFAAVSLAVLPVSGGAGTADEEAARVARLAAMEPVQRETAAVQPLIEIEKTWDIEDTHAVAASPLVTAMSFCRGEMGRDEESSTFYAALGTEMAGWPELDMTAAGADGLSVAWVDDYAWDDPVAAVRDGTAYRLIAWTDTEYEYLNVVFTGLPVMNIRTYEGAEPGIDYGAAYVTLASGTDDPAASAAEIHIRGGGVQAKSGKTEDAAVGQEKGSGKTSGSDASDPDELSGKVSGGKVSGGKMTERTSYRIEFQKKKTKKYGYKKNRISLLGMPEDSDWILLPNPVDPTHVHNLMGFALWREMNADRAAFNMLQSRMVEVCLNGEYMGIFQLIQRVKPERELTQAGCAETDTAARLISKYSVEERPVRYFGKYVLELRLQPKGKTADDCFALYDDYIKLMDSTTDEETFRALAAEHLDMRSVMRFFLFHQSAILDTDNILNNVYVWAVRKGGRLLYEFSPWDMDRSFSVSNLRLYLINEKMTLPIRLLDLDVPGAREALWAEWEQQRSGPLSDDTVGERMGSLETEMNATGAWPRDAQRWNTKDNETLDLGETRDALILHLSDLEEEMRRRWPVTGKDTGNP